MKAFDLTTIYKADPEALDALCKTNTALIIARLLSAYGDTTTGKTTYEFYKAVHFMIGGLKHVVCRARKDGPYEFKLIYNDPKRAPTTHILLWGQKTQYSLGRGFTESCINYDDLGFLSSEEYEKYRKRMPA